MQSAWQGHFLISFSSVSGWSTEKTAHVGASTSSTHVLFGEYKDKQNFSKSEDLISGLCLS